MRPRLPSRKATSDVCSFGWRMVATTAVFPRPGCWRAKVASVWPGPTSRTTPACPDRQRREPVREPDGLPQVADPVRDILGLVGADPGAAHVGHVRDPRGQQPDAAEKAGELVEDGLDHRRVRRHGDVHPPALDPPSRERRGHLPDGLNRAGDDADLRPVDGRHRQGPLASARAPRLRAGAPPACRLARASRRAGRARSPGPGRRTAR